jgi:hypothetical protein
MSRVHGYNNDDHPIDTACGRLAYNITPQGELKEPPLLLITTDAHLVTCRACIKVWGCESQSMWRQIFNGPDVIDRDGPDEQPKHIPQLFHVREET